MQVREVVADAFNIGIDEPVPPAAPAASRAPSFAMLYPTPPPGAGGTTAPQNENGKQSNHQKIRRNN